MLHVPLLSEAYEAALFREDRPQSPAARQEPRGWAGHAEPVESLEPLDLTLPLEGRAVAAEAGDEDLETAPTRPLRLDQIRL
jgi:hypothetical protein